jgi:hypothetical protein
MQDIPELTSRVAEAVVGFLRGALPDARSAGWTRDGWDHQFCTAYQIGCMALVALGNAEKTEWGATPKLEPSLPDVLPFWEDVAVAVLCLARQQRRIEYLSGTGEKHPDNVVNSLSAKTQWTVTNNRPPITANILAGQGTGPAFATPDVVSVLESLGLIKDGNWTAAAETVHWRGSGSAWGLQFDADARFTTEVEQAVAMVPPALRKEIDQLMRITEAQVAEGVARSEAAVETARLRAGPKAKIGPALTAEQVRLGMPKLRENALDWVFFRHWRLGRGWLDDDQAGRALEIFHDRLAIAMRRAVVARLYPGGFVWE